MKFLSKIGPIGVSIAPVTGSHNVYDKHINRHSLYHFFRFSDDLKPGISVKNPPTTFYER